MKKVSLVAGKDRHCCFFMDLADFLCLAPDQRTYSPGGASWVFPRLQEAAFPATAITGFVKALRSSVQSLPDGATAAGVRPGVCNMLASQMPAEHVVQVTGHDLTNISALFEYLDAQLALNMPGARVVAGWPSPPWGHLGMGPVPASIHALKDIGIGCETLEPLIDAVFHFDTASPIMLLKGGAMRPAVHAAFATMIMYYGERQQAHEMRAVHKVLYTALAAKKFTGHHGDQHQLLMRWGQVIKERFDMDNLHLTSLADHDGAAQLAAGMKQLGQSVSSLHEMFNSAIASMNTSLKSLERELAELKSQWPSQYASASPDLPSQSLSPAMLIGPESLGTGPGTGRGGRHDDLQQSAPQASVFDALMGKFLPSNFAAATPEVPLKDVSCVSFYTDFTLKGMPVLSKSNKCRAVIVKEWFANMANDHEARRLGQKKPPLEIGERRRIIEALETHVRSYLKFRFERVIAALPTSNAKPPKVPRTLNTRLMVCALEKVVGKLKKLSDRVNKDAQLPGTSELIRADMQKHRIEVESSTTSAAPRASPKRHCPPGQPPAASAGSPAKRLRSES